ncbi:hypothetical protein B0T20DRAFT_695 [Sordaria brevicollis]|uniref:Secreted protein n=1 Tax=Sordaria brevicollis TaxID=83679 RepID=A0AAE0UGF7_SORBR|nr:hypothetical protein B0T20DRAFT_695 [Sordaria brevicollis]
MANVFSFLSLTHWHVLTQSLSTALRFLFPPSSVLCFVASHDEPCKPVFHQESCACLSSRSFLQQEHWKHSQSAYGNRKVTPSYAFLLNHFCLLARGYLVCSLP